MPQEGEAVSWKKFFVHEAGRTNGAHLSLVRFLTRIGQTEVNSPEACEYVLVLCPAVSRVGTNISEALDSMPAGKPVILVVMHHTFDTHQVVADSRRQVENSLVRLTVDVLFYETELLNCNRNDIARGEIMRFLQGPRCQIPGQSWWNRINPLNWVSDDNTKWIILGACGGTVLVILVIVLIHVM